MERTKAGRRKQKKRIREYNLCRFGENEDESRDLHANLGRYTLSSSEIREDVSRDKQCQCNPLSRGGRGGKTEKCDQVDE